MNDDDRDRARSGASAWDDDADLDRLDALFSGLGAGDRPEGADPAETELLGILADWRADLDERALPPLPAIPEDFGADLLLVVQLGRPARGKDAAHDALAGTDADGVHLAVGGRDVVDPGLGGAEAAGASVPLCRDEGLAVGMPARARDEAERLVGDPVR